MTYQFTPDPNDHELIALMADHADDTATSSAAQTTTNQDPQQAFIQKMVATRLENGMAQVALAEKSGLPQSAVARIESGKGNPTLKTLTNLADAMGYQITLLRKPR